MGNNEVSLLEGIDKHLNLLVRLQAAAFQFTQQKEAEKVAEDWRPYFVIVSLGYTYQLLAGHAGRRGSFAIQNAGPSPVILSNKYFDGPTVAAYYNQGNWNSVQEIFVLGVGGNVTMDSKGGLWAFAANYGLANPQAALNIGETVYKLVTPRGAPNGRAGLENAGVDDYQELGMGAVR